MAMLELNEQNFDQTIKENDFVLLDFWAAWCEPCKIFQKVVEEIAPHYPEFVFASINIEEQPKLAQDFHIQSVPSVMIIRSQVIVYADAGALPTSALSDLLDQTKAIDPKDLQQEKE